MRFHFESAALYVGGDGFVYSFFSREPGRGHGSKLLRSVVKWADCLSMDLTLSVEPYGHKNLSQEELVKFYKKFGFKLASAKSYARGFGDKTRIRHAVRMKRVKTLSLPRN